MRILALDLATNTGYYNGEASPASIKFDKDTRMLSYWIWIKTMLYNEGEVLFDAVVMENAIGQRAQALEVFHMMKTLTHLSAALLEVPVFQYAPSTIKKVFTGNGHAKKDEVIKKCLDMGYDIPYRILKSGKNKGQTRYDDDAADAVAIYHTFLHHEGDK
jgi:Holliday junction resolvasome RuvABC endonuclease subunit